MHPAAHRLRALILEGQLEPPLPRDLGREAAEGAFGPPADAGPAQLGTHRAERLRFELKGRPHPVDVWLDSAATGHVVLVETRAPFLAEPLDPLIARLGEPSRREMARRVPSGFAGMAWVWPERGLTLTLGATTDEARDPQALLDPRAALHLHAYPATDLRGWDALGANAPSSRKHPL